MRIQVKTDQKEMVFPIPSGLFLNGATAGLISRSIKKNGVPVTLSASVLRRLFRELRRVKRRHRGLTLVEVESPDGTHVLVKL